MPATYDIIQLSTNILTTPYNPGGASSAVLIDFVYSPPIPTPTKPRYALNAASWAPVIAPRHETELGGGPLFDPVIETLTIHIFGQSVNECLGSLVALTQVLDQADLWGRGRNVPVVTFSYQPAGSVYGGPLTVPVLGRAPGDQTANLTLQPYFDDEIGYYVIRNVQIRFRRPGTWYLQSFLSANRVPFNSSAEGSDLVWPGASVSGVQTGRGWFPTDARLSMQVFANDAPSFAQVWPNQALTGQTSVGITLTTGNAGEGIAYHGVPFTDGLDVSYTMSVWVKLSVGQGIELRMTQADSAASVQSVGIAPFGTGWTKLSATFTPTTAQFGTNPVCDLHIRTASSGTATRLQVDALKLTLTRNDGRDTDYNPALLDMQQGYSATWTAQTLANAGFENWTTGLPNSWFITGTPTPTITQITGGTHEGISQVRVQTSTGHGYLYQDVTGLPPGAQVHFWYWVRVPGTSLGGTVQAALYDTLVGGINAAHLVATGGYVVEPGTQGGTPPWRLVEVYGTVPAQGTATTSLRLVIDVGVSADVYIDDAGFAQEGGPAPSVVASKFPTLVSMPSPIALQIGNFANGTSIPAGTLIVTNHPDRIQITEAEAIGATTTGTATAIPDSTNRARSNTVLRLTQTSANGEASLSNTVPIAGGSSPGMITRSLLLFAAVRGGGTGNWTLTPAVRFHSQGGNWTRGKPSVVDGTITTPQIINLGLTTLDSTVLTWNLYVSTDAATSASLDIDYIVAVAADDETTAVLTHQAVTYAGAVDSTTYLLVDPRALTRPTPTVEFWSNGMPYAISAQGDPWLVHTGDQVAVVWLATQGNFWRAANASSAVWNTTLRATRYPASLSPV